MASSPVVFEDRGLSREAGVEVSPTPNPRNFVTELAAKIDRSGIEGLLRKGGPEFKLVTVTVTLMAVVTADRYIHRERATTRRRLMQGTTPRPLIAPAV